jgi:hypothetical protein
VKERRGRTALGSWVGCRRLTGSFDQCLLAMNASEHRCGSAGKEGEKRERRMTTFSRTVHGVRKTKKQRPRSSKDEEATSRERRGKRGRTSSEAAKQGNERTASAIFPSLPSSNSRRLSPSFYALLSRLDVLRPPLLKVDGGGVDTEFLDLSLCVGIGEGKDKKVEKEGTASQYRSLRQRQDAVLSSEQEEEGNVH